MVLPLYKIYIYCPIAINVLNIYMFIPRLPQECNQSKYIILFNAFQPEFKIVI